MQAQAHTEAPPREFTTGCCPPFDPAPWQDKELVWKDELFLEDHLRCLFHVPLNMSAHMARNQRAIEAAGAAAEQPLVLCHERSPWRMDVYIAVARSVPGAQMTQLSGRFLTRVYEGPYRDAKKWVADMRRYVAGKNLQLDELYLAYPTCPACAKAYGKNYVVAFAQVRETELTGPPW